jgi:hypothetical protein
MSVGTSTGGNTPFALTLEATGVLTLNQMSPNWSGTYASMACVSFPAVA